MLEVDKKFSVIFGFLFVLVLSSFVVADNNEIIVDFDPSSQDNGYWSVIGTGSLTDSARHPDAPGTTNGLSTSGIFTFDVTYGDVNGVPDELVAWFYVHHLGPSVGSIFSVYFVDNNSFDYLSAFHSCTSIPIPSVGNSAWVSCTYDGDMSGINFDELRVVGRRTGAGGTRFLSVYSAYLETSTEVPSTCPLGYKPDGFNYVQENDGTCFVTSTTPKFHFDAWDSCNALNVGGFSTWWLSEISDYTDELDPGVGYGMFSGYSSSIHGNSAGSWYNFNKKLWWQNNIFLDNVYWTQDFDFDFDENYFMIRANSGLAIGSRNFYSEEYYTCVLNPFSTYNASLDNSISIDIIDIDPLEGEIEFTPPNPILSCPGGSSKTMTLSNGDIYCLIHDEVNSKYHYQFDSWKTNLSNTYGGDWFFATDQMTQQIHNDCRDYLEDIYGYPLSGMMYDIYYFMYDEFQESFNECFYDSVDFPGSAFGDFNYDIMSFTNVLVMNEQYETGTHYLTRGYNMLGLLQGDMWAKVNMPIHPTGFSEQIYDNNTYSKNIIAEVVPGYEFEITLQLSNYAHLENGDYRLYLKGVRNGNPEVLNISNSAGVPLSKGYNDVPYVTLNNFDAGSGTHNVTVKIYPNTGFPDGDFALVGIMQGYNNGEPLTNSYMDTSDIILNNNPDPVVYFDFYDFDGLSSITSQLKYMSAFTVGVRFGDPAKNYTLELYSPNRDFYFYEGFNNYPITSVQLTSDPGYDYSHSYVVGGKDPWIGFRHSSEYHMNNDGFDDLLFRVFEDDTLLDWDIYIFNVTQNYFSDNKISQFWWFNYEPLLAGKGQVVNYYVDFNPTDVIPSGDYRVSFDYLSDFEFVNCPVNQYIDGIGTPSYIRGRCLLAVGRLAEGETQKLSYSDAVTYCAELGSTSFGGEWSIVNDFDSFKSIFLPNANLVSWYNNERVSSFENPVYSDYYWANPNQIVNIAQNPKGVWNPQSDTGDNYFFCELTDIVNPQGIVLYDEFGYELEVDPNNGLQYMDFSYFGDPNTRVQLPVRFILSEYYTEDSISLRTSIFNKNPGAFDNDVVDYYFTFDVDNVREPVWDWSITGVDYALHGDEWNVTEGLTPLVKGIPQNFTLEVNVYHAPQLTSPPVREHVFEFCFDSQIYGSTPENTIKIDHPGVLRYYLDGVPLDMGEVWDPYPVGCVRIPMSTIWEETSHSGTFNMSVELISDPPSQISWARTKIVLRDDVQGMVFDWDVSTSEYIAFRTQPGTIIEIEHEGPGFFPMPSDEHKIWWAIIILVGLGIMLGIGISNHNSGMSFLAIVGLGSAFVVLSYIGWIPLVFSVIILLLGTGVIAYFVTKKVTGK